MAADRIRPRSPEAPCPHKIYVMLGFHTSFYHSWRGDTPDEAGFGIDIRCVRAILGLLDEANAAGQEARGYWDLDVYWNLEEIIPHHAPDIIEGIRRRVQGGQDEIVLGYYNNGANHAATERELRAAITYALENPRGSGLRQVFGQTSTLLRPQESMYTAGQNAILLEEGITGLILYYTAVPFNALSTFIPTLPPEQRYNLLWLRGQPEEPPIELWPCISLADLVDEVCLEALMLKLRRLQIAGQVQSDLLIHVNFDADSDAWLPVRLPRFLAWFPNTGGLQEYIDAVNRYPWASFTIPSAYRQGHEPRGEVLVRQDLADGAFDGHYSWAEKYTSLLNWTALERSRLHAYRAQALAGRVPKPLAEEIDRRLWQGADAPFFQRLVGLSTTHFGMSTPVIHEERQARAQQLLGEAAARAARVERAAARAQRSQQDAAASSVGRGKALYVLDVFAPTGGPGGQRQPARALIRVPLILPPGVGHLRVEETSGRPLPASLINPKRLRDGNLAGELLFTDTVEPERSRTYLVTPRPAQETAPKKLAHLRNSWLDLRLSEEDGVHSFTFEGKPAGGSDFLEPFITYRSRNQPQSWFATRFTVDDLAGERWDGLSRARMHTQIAMETPHGRANTDLRYTFTLFDQLPYLLVDVSVTYADTPREDLVQTFQQKLGRLLDLRWIEVAPCPLHPCLSAPVERPLRVWKHNHLGVTSFYDLDYGQINRRNGDLDSFNHQVTAGWVAVSDGQAGLLLAESAPVLASMAFCPMRLREREGLQHLWLNPFGSYHGRQLDYSHLGGSGVGAELTAAISGALRPNGPSYNGRTLSFSLLLAPYRGDEPPAALQADAGSFFYPPGVLYQKTPAGLDVLVPDDLRQQIAAGVRQRQQRGDAPLPPPQALLAGPSDRAIDLAWEPPGDVRATGYEVRWRAHRQRDWQHQEIATETHWRVGGLKNGRRYIFQLRTLAPEQHSAWTDEISARPGRAKRTSLLSATAGLPLSTLLRMAGQSLAHVIRARLGRPLD